MEIRTDDTYLLVDLCTPPLEPLHPAREYNAEEDDHDAESKTRVKSSAQHHVVLPPPVLSAIANFIVEDVAHDRPDGEIETSGRRNPTQTPENDGEIHLSEYGLPVFAGKVPQDDR